MNNIYFHGRFSCGKRVFLAFLCVVLMFALILPSCSPDNGGDAEDKNDTEISGSPTSVTGNKQVWMYATAAMLSSSAKWNNCAAETDVAILKLSDIKKYTASDIKKVTDFLSNNDVKIAVESGGLVSAFGTDSFHNAEKSMAYNSVNHHEKGEYKFLKPLIDAGAEISYLIFMNPITSAMYTNADHRTTGTRYMSIAEAAQQTAELLGLWREHIPQAEFIYGVDFYNYGWKDEYAYDFVYDNSFGEGDFYYELDLFSAAAEDMGIPFYGVMAHNPYDYAMGRHVSSVQTILTPSKVDWMARLKSLDTECESRGMNFMLVLSSDATGIEGTDQKYFIEQVRYINKVAESGATPEIYVLEAGIKYPDIAYPDTTEYSFTWNVLNIAGQVKNGVAVDISKLMTVNKVPAPPNITLFKEWTFDESAEGWDLANNISTFEVKNGYLSVESIGADPHFLCSSGLGFSASDADYLYLRYVNISNGSTRMEFFFATEESPGMDEVKTIKFNVDEMSDDENIWSEIYIDLNQCRAWEGTLTSIRIDPGVAAGEFRFDSIAFYSQR